MERHENQLANDHYRHCYGSEQVHRILGNALITDGIKEVAEKEQCFWFLEIIVSYQMYKEFKNAEHQIWKLERVEGSEFEVTALDTSGNILAIQKIPFTDFFFRELKVYKKGNIILLPSED